VQRKYCKCNSFYFVPVSIFLIIAKEAILSDQMISVADPHGSTLYNQHYVLTIGTKQDSLGEEVWVPGGTELGGQEALFLDGHT